MPESGSFVYLNGDFIARGEAKFDIEDRGSLFADGVYEVLRYHRGKALAMTAHVDRLRGSLKAIRLVLSDPVETLASRSDELMQRNGFRDAVMYWHISRGSAPRAHPIPSEATPTILMIAYPAPPMSNDAPPMEVSAILREDVRWHHCAIKSLMLLPAVLAQDDALRADADHAILHRGDTVTEGAAQNVFIVRDNTLWTHPADQWILAGITRQLVINVALAAGLDVREEPFSTTFLKEADEILLTGTTMHVASVVRLDGAGIGDGQPGPIARRLQSLLLDHMARTCGN